MSVSVDFEESEEPMPYRFRFTDVDGEAVKIEVGENFDDATVNAGERALMDKIGLRMALIGMRFLGLSPAESKMIGALIIQSASSPGGDE